MTKQNTKIPGFQEKFIGELQRLHPTYDFSKTVYVTARQKVEYICAEGYVRYALPPNLLAGRGCITCGYKSSSEKQKGIKNHARKRRLSLNEIVDRAKSIHDDKYDYSKSVQPYNTDDRIIVVCTKNNHGEFYPTVHNHIHSESGCPKCVHHESQSELNIKAFIESLGVQTKKHVLKSRKHIDIFCPDFNFGIEYHGLYWHSEERRGQQYHNDKLSEAKEEGITLIQIFEDEWLTKPEIVRERIKNKLGFSEKLYARKTTIRPLVWREVRSFLETHHIQGAGSPSGIQYGLIYEERLVAVMTFSKLRYEKGGNNDYELRRYCSDGTIVGGFSKLLSHFVKEHEVDSVTTYSDRRWNTGNVYLANGFSYISTSLPNYFWCKGTSRFSREKFQKHKLVNVLEKFDPSLTERENCEANGYWRVFDCGSDKWILKTEN